MNCARCGKRDDLVQVSYPNLIDGSASCTAFCCMDCAATKNKWGEDMGGNVCRTRSVSLSFKQFSSLMWLASRLNR